MLRISSIMPLCCLLLAVGCSENTPRAVRAGEDSVPSVRRREAAFAPAQFMTEDHLSIEVRGRMFYPNHPVRLAGNFFCVARLMDMGGRDDRRAQPREIDRQIIPGPLALPLSYVLNIEGHAVNPAHVYMIDAFIFVPENPQNPEPDSGTPLFRSKNPVPVLTGGNSAWADIELTMRPLPSSQE